MTSVDVVIPCYNYAHYLPFAVESALNQRDVDVRVLIVDDKSPDNTPEVASELAAKDRRVNYTRNAENLGLVGAINVGVAGWASADYTMVLSADDAAAPGAFARAAQVLDAHPEAVMAYGMAKIIGGEDFPRGGEDLKTATSQIISGRRFLKCACIGGNPLATPTAVVRTTAQARAGAYESRLAHTCDLENWMRLAILGPIAVLHDTQGFYRWHGLNLAAQYGPVIDDRRARVETCEYVYRRNNGAAVPDFSDWITAMKRKCGEEAVRIAFDALAHNDWTHYDKCLAFIEDTAPDITRSAKWARLRLMRAMGWKLRHSPIGRVVAGEYGKPQSGSSPDAIDDWRSDPSKAFGWWPQPGEFEVD